MVPTLYYPIVKASSYFVFFFGSKRLYGWSSLYSIVCLCQHLFAGILASIEIALQSLGYSTAFPIQDVKDAACGTAKPLVLDILYRKCYSGQPMYEPFFKSKNRIKKMDIPTKI